MITSFWMAVGVAIIAGQPIAQPVSPHETEQECKAALKKFAAQPNGPQVQFEGYACVEMKITGKEV